MARRKKTKTIVRRARASSPIKTKSRRKSSGSGKVKVFQMDAMMWGAGSELTSGYVAKVTDSIPFLAQVPANIADEVIRGGVAWGMAKGYLGSGLKSIGRTGLTVENAMIGKEGVRLWRNRTGGNAVATAGGSTFMYG